MRRTVLKTCGRRRTWQMRADAVARLGDGDAVALAARPARRSRAAACRARRRARRARRRCARATACSSACSAVIALPVGVDRLLLGGELGFGRLERRRQLVGLEHPLEDLVLERLDLGLREGDLLLDGVVFLLVFTAIACSRNFDRRPWWTATSFSIARRAFWFSASRSLAAATRCARGLEARLERLLALGLVGERGGRRRPWSRAAAGRSGVRGQHASACSSQKKGPAEAEPEVYTVKLRLLRSATSRRRALRLATPSRGLARRSSRSSSTSVSEGGPTRIRTWNRPVMSRRL